MAINSLKAVLFIAGGAVVAGGSAYVTGALDIFFPEKPAEVASLPASQRAPSAVEPQAVAPKVEEESVPAIEEATKPLEAEPEVVVPTFDIVRVEPDGSMVIAGRAAPVANIEIVTGATVIGRGESNEAGDFAIVLDKPLKPGDYSIVLRSTTRDAIVATSSETAIVSVPDHPSGQVLALVEQPGASSRLITVPEIAAQKQDRPVAQPGQPVAAEPLKPAAETEQAAAQTDQPATEVASAPQPDEVPTEQAASTAQDEPEAEEEAELAGVPTVAAPAAEKPQDEQQIAAVAEQKPAQEQAAASTDGPRIAVEAVEIEGSRVFVAGRAEAGSRVRVYANDILLGDAQTSEGGRFLVEAERDLPVGDYIVRADLLGRNAEVLARAAVPFAREPGEAVAAVAAPEPQPTVQQPAAAAQPQVAQAQTEPARADVEAAQTTDQGASRAPQAAQQVASAPAPADSTPAVQSDASSDMQVTGPKLQNVAGSVIIRRGDTLWHISKRVYGQGVRYTTIYLANQEQIADPNRIWPGQVFNVPEQTEAGEDADMSTIADRIPGGQAETR
jgi:nucleoid-associated protein YgaU